MPSLTVLLVKLVVANLFCPLKRPNLSFQAIAFFPTSPEKMDTTALSASLKTISPSDFWSVLHRWPVAGDLLDTPEEHAVAVVSPNVSEMWARAYPKAFCCAVFSGPAFEPSRLIFGNYGREGMKDLARFLIPSQDTGGGRIRHVPIYYQSAVTDVPFRPVPVPNDPTGKSELVPMQGKGGFTDYGAVPCIMTVPGSYELTMGFMPPRPEGPAVYLAPLPLEDGSPLTEFWKQVELAIRKIVEVAFQHSSVEVRAHPMWTDGKRGRVKYMNVMVTPLVGDDRMNPLPNSIDDAVMIGPGGEDPTQPDTQPSAVRRVKLSHGFYDRAGQDPSPLQLEPHRTSWRKLRIEDPVFMIEGISSFQRNPDACLELRVRTMLIGGRLDRSVANHEEEFSPFRCMVRPWETARVNAMKQAQKNFGVSYLELQGADDSYKAELQRRYRKMSEWHQAAPASPATPATPAAAAADSTQTTD